jgi:hypothetical protein
VAYAIYKSSTVEIIGPSFLPVPGQDSLLISACDPPTLLVQVFAFAANGSYEVCESYALIMDVSSFDCCLQASVAGVIATEEDEAIKGVTVEVSGNTSWQTQTTAIDGVYAFIINDPETSATITPTKDDDLLNGVTTFDLVLIAKHILGVQPLDSPYKLIAADANGSGTISTLDLIFLRKAILGVNDYFPNNSSWRFIPADYDFPDEENPWLEAFPETIDFNTSEGPILLDFTGIKIGDVNGSAVVH